MSVGDAVSAADPEAEQGELRVGIVDVRARPACDCVRRSSRCSRSMISGSGGDRAGGVSARNGFQFGPPFDQASCSFLTSSAGTSGVV